LAGVTGARAAAAPAVSGDHESHRESECRDAHAHGACEAVAGWGDGAAGVGPNAFAAGYLETEKHFRRIMGYEYLWVLEAKLQELRELRLERLRSTSTVSVGNPLTQEAA